MWPKFLNSKWFDRLFSSAIAILAVLVAQSLITERESSASIQTELDKKASIEYVNKQDENIVNTLNQHIQESNRSDEIQMKYIMSIDANVRTLLNKK